MDTTTLTRRTVLLTTAGLLGTGPASGQTSGGEANESESEQDSPDIHEPEEEEEEHTPGLRLINISPDVPALDVSVNDERTVEGLTHLNPETDILPVPEEVTEETTTTVSAALPDGSFPEGAKTEAEIPVRDSPPQGGWTVFFVGEQCEVSDRLFRPVVVPDDHLPTPAGMSRVTAHHFAPDVPRGDVLLPDGTPLFEDIGFGEWKTKTIPAVDSEVTIVASETGEEIESFDIMPKEGAVHSASLVGYQNPDNIPTLAEENPPPGKDDWSLGLAISEDAIVGVEGEEGQEEDEAQSNETNQTTHQ